MPNAHIERYFNEQCLIPALKAIGQSRQVEARTDLQPHHENNLEIHLVMDGKLNWWVENEIHTLKPGSIYLTKPQELHGAIKNTIQPCTLTWLQVDPNALTDSSLAQDLLNLTERTCQGAHSLIADVESMLIEIRNPKEDSPRFLSSCLNLFLAKLLRQYQNTEQQESYPEQLKALLKHIEEQLECEHILSIEDLAAFINLSRSRIFQLFEAHIGQSPISYMNTQRIERAKQQLRETDLAVTSIAMNLGYASSQHFATAFKRMTGMTPRDYRKLETILPKATEKELGRQLNRGY